MAITYNIPNKAWVRVQDSTSDIVKLGKFVATANGELKNIKVGVFKRNGTGTFRLRLHSSQNVSAIYAQSDLLDLASITGTNFIGNVRFDFSSAVLSINKTYWVSIEAVTYTRTADSSYVGWIHDQPMTSNVITANYPTEYPIRMEIFYK